MPLIVGLTGGIASGKSTVSSWLKNKGIPVWDADARVASILQDAWHPLCLELASMDRSLVNDEGIPIRAALRRRAMQHEDQNTRLKSMFASYLHSDRANWLNLHASSAVVVLDVPLLFESNTPHDKALVVDVSTDMQKERLRRRNPNLSDVEIDRWLNMQMSRENRREKATWILDNNGDVDALYSQLNEWLKRIESEKHLLYNTSGLYESMEP